MQPLFLLLPIALAVMTLLRLRLRTFHARGLLLRWGIPRVPRPGFASRREVREHLGRGAGRGRPTAAGYDSTERESAS